MILNSSLRSRFAQKVTSRGLFRSFAGKKPNMLPLNHSPVEANTKRGASPSQGLATSKSEVSKIEEPAPLFEKAKQTSLGDFFKPPTQRVKLNDGEMVSIGIAPTPSAKPQDQWVLRPDQSTKGQTATGSDSTYSRQPPSEVQQQTTQTPTPTNRLHVLSWNVCGMSALSALSLDTGVLGRRPLLCLGETHLLPNVGRNAGLLPGPALNKVFATQMHAVCTDRTRYSGVSVCVPPEAGVWKLKEFPGPGEFAREGRIVVAEGELCTVVSVYVPNAGQGLKRLGPRTKVWDPWFFQMIGDLTKGGTWPVYVVGDLNVAHTEMDLANPKTNKKTPGFSDEERSNFTLLLKAGWVDVWRTLNPGKKEYSFFTSRSPGARERNVGWRLDYLLASQGKAAKAVSSVRICKEIFGSDHLPIEAIIDLDELK